MKRRDALRTLALGIGTISLPRAVRSATDAGKTKGLLSPGITTAGCWVTPDETQGPFYFDPGLLRQDIREGKPGVLLDLEITVIDNACIPRPGTLVDLWQCDKDGCYSGYNQPTCNSVGQTFLRGTQSTNSNGVVNFTTIYPGWYPGRATHIHFKARTAQTTYKTSQFAFPEAANAAVYASPLYVARGPNPTSNQEDGIFGGQEEPLHQTVAITGTPESGMQGTYTIGLTALPAGVEETESPSASRLRLTGGPAPFSDRATLHATLPSEGVVKLTICDALGRQLRLIASGWRPAGTFEAVWDGRDDLGRGLPAGVYMASLEHGGRRASTRLVRVR